MGTTLTGTTPQDTYDSLIKVTNNGPLSSTARYLSDGLGNDSVLALSTTALGIGTNTPVGKLTIAGTSAQPPSSGTTPNSLLQIKGSLGNQLNIGSNTAAGDYGSYIQASDNNLAVNYPLNLQPNGGNVGIGTSAPAYKLQADVTDATAYSSANTLTASPIFWVNNNSTTAGTAATIRLDGGALNGNAAATISSVHVGNGSSALTFGTRNLNSNITERVRILAEGGITFNGDTSQANALDDYEEGTWTPTITGAGGNPTVTYAAGNTGGIYTKIGNQVTVSFEVRWTALSGGSGAVSIAGLPYSRRVTTLPDGDRLIIDSYNNTISGKYLTGNVGSGNSSIALSMVNSAAAPTDLLISNLDTSGLGFLRGTVTYFV